MKTLASIVANPTSLDSLANFCGEIPASEWLAVLTRTRDAGVLERCNFEVAERELAQFGEDVETFRFGHWACGWWEALCVRENTPAAEVGQEIHDCLISYGVLDEEAYSLAEMNEANEVWERCYRMKERIEYVRRYRNQFEFRDFADMLGCIRGKYFCGYASELLA